MMSSATLEFADLGDADMLLPPRRSIAAEARRVQQKFLANLRTTSQGPMRTGHGMPRRRPSGNGVSQDFVAECMEISPRYYGDLERGCARWNEDLVRRFEVAIGLDRGGEAAASIRDVLWNMLIDHGPRGCLTVVTAADRLHVDEQRAPSYISNDWWEMLYHNEALGEWFPELVDSGTNVMVWATSPQASTRLVDHVEKWLRPMLAALRGAYYGNLNGNRELTDKLEGVIARICHDSPIAKHYWAKDKYRFHAGPTGDVRAVLHPTKGEKIVLLHSTGVSQTSNARMVTLYEMRVNEHGILERVPFEG
jgi:hypothetical protein